MELKEFTPLKHLGLYYTKDKTRLFCDSLHVLRKRAYYHEENLLQLNFEPYLKELNLQSEQARKENDFKRWIEINKNFTSNHLDLIDKIDPELAAMMQALRSQFDIFAQIINSELFDEPRIITQSIVSFQYISRLVSSSSSLKVLLDEINEDTNFKYLDDFVNTSKHNFTQNIAIINYEPSIIAYERKGRDIPPKDIFWILSILKPWVDEKTRSLCSSLTEIQKSKSY